MSACLWLATGGSAGADFIGLNIDAGSLSPALNHDYGYSENHKIDLIDDLEIDNPEQSSMVLILEHPIRLLPNIRYQGLDLERSSSVKLDADISLNGQTFNSGNEITSTYELSQNDIVFYYQLMKKGIDLNLGVDLKSFAGEVSLNGINRTSIEVEETIPLLYLSARYELPNSRFYFGANINADFINLGLSESSAQDSTILLGYDSGNGLGVEGGFKYFSLDLDGVDSLENELEYDGVFLNGYFNF